MSNIWPIFTAHRNNGLCNNAGLVSVLNEIKPDVIFEEFRPGDFEVLNEKGNLETQAIKKYRQNKSFQEVPVDRFKMPQNLYEESQKLFDYMELKSPDYRKLMNINTENVAHGFSYLNSDICDKLMAKLSEFEENIINDSNNKELILGLKNWRSFNQKREIEMVKNIYAYTQKNTFSTGIFLVGAAHKFGVIREIKKYTIRKDELINWKFFFNQNQ